MKARAYGREEDRARLLQAAEALLGGKRAAELEEALAERAAQCERVGQAAVATGEQAEPGSAEAWSVEAWLAEPGPAEAQPSEPGPASLAAWEAAAGRAEELEPNLRAWAWRAPVPAGRTGARRKLEAGVRGGLEGWVMGVKDVIDVAGMPTRAGVEATPAKPVTVDAPVVARARAAGAAIAGKTQCTAWALNDPAVTRSPWHPEHTPGGSSAGSAVAVATAMCTATIDTQTAGDVLRPAAYNGVVGFKPTHGWVSVAGTQRVAPSIDTIGVIAQRTADAAALARVLADEPSRFVVRDEVPRIGVLDSPFTDEIGPEAQDGLDRALRWFTAAGAGLRRVTCPVDLALVHAAHRVITFAECAALHLGDGGPADSHRYPPRARDLLDLGLVTPAYRYLQAQRVRRDATERLAAMFGQAEVLISPATAGPAPARETTGDSRLQIPWTLCGFPALALPCGLTRDGLPLAVQLVAGRGGEPALLSAAHWCEPALSHDVAPPGRAR